MIFVLMASGVSAETWSEQCDANKQIGTCSASVAFDQATGDYSVTSDTSGCISVDVQIDSSVYPHKFVGMTIQDHVTQFDKSKKVNVKPLDCRIYAAFKTDSETKAEGMADGKFSVEGTWHTPDGVVVTFQDGIISDGVGSGTYTSQGGHYANEQVNCDVQFLSSSQAMFNCSPKPGVQGAPLRPFSILTSR